MYAIAMNTLPTPVHKNMLLLVSSIHPPKRTYFMDGPFTKYSFHGLQLLSTI